MNRKMKKVLSMGTACVLAVSLMTGCSSGQSASADPAITMEGRNVSMGEALLYTEVMKSQYESYYGDQIWDMEVSDGVTFGQSVKDGVTEDLVKMNYLASLAEQYDVSVSDEEKANYDTYVSNFKQNLGEDVISENNITDDDIRNLIEMNAISNTVYQKIINEMTVELTDEETENARCIKVQHILIPTTETTKEDENGDTVDMTDEEITAYKEQQYATAEEVLQKAQDGEDFKTLADEYSSENAGFEFSFDRNGYSYSQQSSMVEPFYTAAWELSEGEISGIVETEYGYHIIKCVSENDETETAQAISSAQSTKKQSAADDQIQADIDAKTYTLSEAWKNYTITSPAAETTAESDTTADSTETSADTTADSSADTTAETTTESETESETAAE